MRSRTLGMMLAGSILSMTAVAGGQGAGSTPVVDTFAADLTVTFSRVTEQG